MRRWILMATASVCGFVAFSQVLQHGAAGDGLPVIYEYRGIWADGGATFTNAQHVHLSPVRKELLVQVIVEDDYLAGLGTGSAVNLSAMQALNLPSVMQKVAKFYSDLARGLGIDLYWVFTPFTMPVTPFTYESNNVSIPDLYKHTGTIEYQGIHSSTITGGSTWITHDHRLYADNDEEHARYFPEKRTSVFIATNRNDTVLKDFIKVALPMRTGERLRNGQVRMTTSHHAEAHFDASSAFFQGAHVDVVNIAEENFVDKGTHYPPDVFLNRLAWAIAHEIGHLIIRGQTSGNWAAYHHHLTPSNNALMSADFPPPKGLSDAVGDPREIEKIDLPNRASVLPPNP